MKLVWMYNLDRVPPEEKDESNIEFFRDILEVYEQLLYEDRRAEYDHDLKCGHKRYPNYHGEYKMHQEQYHHHRHCYRDLFAEFNKIFRNDPFFSESFKGMNDLLSMMFQNQNSADGTFSTPSYGHSGFVHAQKHENKHLT